jgi:hypothetical protein
VVVSLVLRALSGRDDGGPIGMVGLMSDSKRHCWLSQLGTLHRLQRGYVNVNYHVLFNKITVWQPEVCLMLLFVV